MFSLILNLVFPMSFVTAQIFYKRKLLRFQEYDYSSKGLYFITVATRGMFYHLGKIIEEEVELSELGKIAKANLLDICNHFEYAYVHEFVIMPNHIHFILEIGYNPNWEKAASLGNKFGKHRIGSISLIVQQYKASVTRYARRNGYKNFAWKSRFYEHIICSSFSLQNIIRYIRNNPKNWKYRQ